MRRRRRRRKRRRRRSSSCSRRGETEKEERCNGNTFDAFVITKHLVIGDTKLKLNENLICIF